MAIYSLRFTLQKTTVKNIIKHLLKENLLTGEVRQNGDFIYLETEQDKEVLELLGQRLPVSIFMGGFQECEIFPDDTVVAETKNDLSICPSCVEKLFDENSENYLNYLQYCDICGAQSIRELSSSGLRLDGVVAKDMEAAFQEAVSLFQEAGALVLQTHYGDVTVFKDFSPECEYLLGLSSGALSKSFWMNEDENLMLASMEKPILELETKETSQLRQESFNLFKAAVTDDAMTYLLFYFLKKECDQDTCFVKTGRHADHYLAFTENLKPSAPRLEAYANTGLRFITKGSRGVTPFVFDVSTEQDQLSLFGGIVAQQHGRTVECDTLRTAELKEVESVITDIEGNYGIEHGVVKKLARDDALTLFIKNHLEKEAFVGCYLSLESERSSITLLHNGKARKILEFAAIPFDIKVIFNGLEKMNDTAIKLLGNYKERFQDEYNVLLQKLDDDQRYSSSLQDIFGILGFFIDPGFREVSYAKLYNQAIGYSSEGGLKVDMKLVKVNDKYMFDWQRSLMSIISFKLAGASREMIAYSLFESFCDFINENIIEVKKQSQVDDVYLGGSFWSNKIFTKRLLKHSSNIYRPTIPTLPLEGVTQSIGGIYA